MSAVRMFGRREVQHSAELRRILEIPRRTWEEEDLARLADDMTRLLRKPNGTMNLRPVQALALHDIGVHGGLFAPIRVGGGKTLISLLAPYVLDCRKVLLILPAGLVAKTERERMHLNEHWQISPATRITSFEKLGRVEGAHMLESWAPELLIVDECHRLKNKKAAVTRRVVRYMREHPGTKFVAMSGTIGGSRADLRDFAHILRWCLKENATVPTTEGETEEWADALGEASRVNPLQRVAPGALLTLATPEERQTLEPITAARRGFQRRLTDTPGVVATGGEQVACSLYISALQYEPNATTEANFFKLRDTAMTPDDWTLWEAIEVWACARQLALGMHHIWDPRPPDEWRDKRKAWGQFVRDVLSHSRTLDSERQIKDACKAGTLPRLELDEWEEIGPTFTPNVKAVWHDDTALKVCEAWLAKGPGIVWTAHSFFGRELARRAKVPYFGRKGLDAQGNDLNALADHHRDTGTPPPAIVASIKANGTGRNLQPWSRNLVTTSPNAEEWEQLLGRTHRDGQKADTVEVDVLMSCWEHWDGWTKALAGARAIQDTTGGAQKLLIADLIMPSDVEILALRGARWKKNAQILAGSLG